MFDTFKTLAKIMNILSAFENKCKWKEKMEMYASSDEYKLLWEKWIWNQNLGDYKCPNFTFEMEKIKIKQTAFRFWIYPKLVILHEFIWFPNGNHCSCSETKRYYDSLSSGQISSKIVGFKQLMLSIICSINQHYVWIC